MSQKNLIDARIRQTPLNRWENEGGATATGHEMPAIKTLIPNPIFSIEQKPLGFSLESALKKPYKMALFFEV